MQQAGSIKVVEDEHRMRAMLLCRGLALPMALRAAVQLKVPDILIRADGSPMSAKDIAAQIRGPSALDLPRASACLDRILRVLAANEVLSEEFLDTHEQQKATRLYRLTPTGRFFVQVGNEESLGPLALLSLGKTFASAWQFLQEVVLTDCEPFVKAHGKTQFELAKEDHELNAMFNTAMSNHTKMVMRLLLNDYNGFGGIKTLVDVGGGLGASLGMIVAKYPHIRGINFDQPHVISRAPQYPGVEHVGGDMFDVVPSGDAIFMKWILHDWDDERCIKVLRNCHRSLPSNGKMIVCDAILEERTRSNVHDMNVLYGDLTMLTINPGGRERSEEELVTIALAAGFKRLTTHVKIDSLCVFELAKTK